METESTNAIVNRMATTNNNVAILFPCSVKDGF